MSSDKKITSFSGAVVLVTSMLGYGIIAAPIATSYLGYYGASLLLFFVGFITFCSLFLIFKTCEEVKRKTKKDPTFYSLVSDISPALGMFTSVILALTCFSANLAYIKKLAEWITRSLNFNDNKQWVTGIVVSLLQFLGSVLIKDLGKLKFVSYISIGSCLLVGLTIWFYLFTVPKDGIVTSKFKGGFGDAIGTFVFGLCCQAIVPVIFSGLKEGESMFSVSFLGTIMGLVLLSMFAIPGYFLCGDNFDKKNIKDIISFFITPSKDFEANIASSIDNKKVLVKVCSAAFIIVLFCSYLFQAYAGIDTIIDIIKKIGVKQKEKSISIIKYLIAAVYISLSLVLSRIEMFDNVVNFAGVYFLNVISFILPPISYFYNVGIRKNKMISLLAFVSLFSGIASMGASTYFNYFATK